MNRIEYLEKTYPFVKFDLCDSDFEKTKNSKTYVFEVQTDIIGIAPFKIVANSFLLARLRFFRILLNKPKIRYIPIFWDRIYISNVKVYDYN